jgi:hypothetical protein
MSGANASGFRVMKSLVLIGLSSFMAAPFTFLATAEIAVALCPAATAATATNGFATYKHPERQPAKRQGKYRETEQVDLHVTLQNRRT